MIYAPIPSGKVCYACHIWYPRSELCKDASRSEGVKALCAQCRCSKDSRYYTNNKDKCLTYASNRYQSEIVRIKARRHDKYQQKRDSVCERYRVAYSRNPDKFRDRSRQSRLRHPQKHRAIANRWTQRQRQYPITLTGEQWQYALDWFNNCCAYCGNQQGLFDSMKLTADHVIPLSNPNCTGTVASNIVPACKGCNSSKRNHDVTKWLIRKFGNRKSRQILQRIEQYFATLKE